jgi:hypothetical protein
MGAADFIHQRGCRNRRGNRETNGGKRPAMAGERTAKSKHVNVLLFYTGEKANKPPITIVIRGDC